MEVIRSLEGWSAPTVVSVGNFDGVHLAHRRLLQAVVEEARERGARALAISFEPHPSRVLTPAAAPALITPLEEKIRLLAATGLDGLVLLPFTPELSQLSPRGFVQQVLVRGLGVQAVHEGENFRFGHRQQGTVATLQGLADEFGFALRLHAEVRVRGEVVSSSRIRALIAAGAVERARWLLGRAFTVRGRVAAGRGVGREQTVPTLNLASYAELLPAAGVYFTVIEIDGRTWAAASNVGVRPTFGPGAPLTVESHVLHPPPGGWPEASGTGMGVSFLHRLRAEQRFESPAALKVQIGKDIAIAERYFRRIGLG